MDIRTCKAHQVKGQILEAWWKDQLKKYGDWENDKVGAIEKQLVMIRQRPEVVTARYDPSTNSRTINVIQSFARTMSLGRGKPFKLYLEASKPYPVTIQGDGIFVKLKLLMRAGKSNYWGKTSVEFFIHTSSVPNIYNDNKPDFLLPATLNTSGRLHTCWGNFPVHIEAASRRHDFVLVVDLLIEYVRFGNYDQDLHALRAWPKPTKAEIKKFRAY